MYKLKINYSPEEKEVIKNNKRQGEGVEMVLNRLEELILSFDDHVSYDQFDIKDACDKSVTFVSLTPEYELIFRLINNKLNNNK